LSEPKSETLRKALEKVLEEMASDFGVDAPRVKVVDDEGIRSGCDTYACGCYNYKERTIYLHERCASSLETLLHEFAHHLQLIMAGGDPYKAYSDFGKSHCQRSHESWAKIFARVYYDYYEEEWDKVVKGGE
jgi:hypothetical protein